MRVGYFGPRGTFTEEALRVSAPVDVDAVPLPSIYATVCAVADGTVERGVVPIENALEGSVDATLDALAVETDGVVIVGEVVLPITHCLIALEDLELADIRVVTSHPQANAQCARFLREQLPGAVVLAASSTSEAVRMVAEDGEPGRAAIGHRLAAELYGCTVLREGIEDLPGNVTRFVWLARAADGDADGPSREPYKTSVVFWGGGDQTPGWLVGCLSELASRGVNLTRIESRPRRMGLGQYMFFVDLEGHASDPPVAEALAGLAAHCEALRTLGTYPAAR
ncbi:MAG: prephenate dehydratase [Solirubrobacterales bacterium]